ncbi:MAG: dihydroorotase [Oscillatoriaceae cyanobacterium]
MTSVLLQQVRVLDPVSGVDQITDVMLADGKIKAIEPEIPLPEGGETELVDGRGLILGPGLVDLYSHSGEPGFEDRESLASLAAAATAGGFTRLAILPNTTPPLDNPGGLALVQEIIAKLPSPVPQVYMWGALTQGVKGEQMAELAELAKAGIVGFADGQPLEHLGLLRRMLEYLQPLGLPVAIWPRSRYLAGNGVVREGPDSIRLGLPGEPAIAETAAIASILEIVAAIGTPVHIMRVSTARSVELIQEAKDRGLPVTASTTWMHLLLNTENIGGTPSPMIPYDTSFRVQPPLGNPADQWALIRGIRDGYIEAVAIDHTPYTYEEKQVSFVESPPGAIGLEIALPLLWQNLVVTGKLAPLHLWRLLSTQPALCLKQTPPAMFPGHPAELTLFDPNQTWTADETTLKSRSTNTPWFRQQLTGRVVRTFHP